MIEHGNMVRDGDRGWELRLEIDGRARADEWLPLVLLAHALHNDLLITQHLSR